MSKIITPPANRGLNSQNKPAHNSLHPSLLVGIDWIQGVIPISSLDDVDDFLFCVNQVLSDSTTIHPGVGRRYGRDWANHARANRGVMYHFNLPGEHGDDGSMSFSFNAQALVHQRTARDRARFINFLRTQWQARFTRIDIAIDDYQKRLQYDAILSACEQGHFSGFRKWRPLPGGSEPGWTFYLGSRDAAKFIRIYDKEAETRLAPVKNRINAIRFEVEFHDRKAEALADVICEQVQAKEDWRIAYVLGTLATKEVCFLIKSDKNLNRCEILSWWSDFISSFIMDVELSVSYPKPSLERTAEWVIRQVSRPLAMLQEMYGEGFIVWLLEHGKERLKALHEGILENNRIDYLALALS